MTTPIKPLDPDSDRGQELSGPLHDLLDEIEEAIEERRRKKDRDRAA